MTKSFPSEAVRFPVLTVAQNLVLEKVEMLVLNVSQGTCLPLDAASVVGGVINWWSKVIVNFNYFVKI